MFEGYYVDPVRTTVCGLKPTPEQRELVETGARIVEALMEQIRPGGEGQGGGGSMAGS
jgi:Xaa-Pro dipeptidase